MKTTPSSSGLEPGLLFDNRYQLEEIIGHGGMGEVWAATDTSLESPVAIKVLHGSIVHDEAHRKLFAREARVMEALGDMSRHITRVLAHGVLDDGVPYLIMERLKGEGLEALLKRQKILPLPQVVDIVSQLCKALAITHAEGFVHRDLKPPNIFICPDHDEKIFVKLLDFGVVKALSEVNENTAQENVVGTPNYMSPEQLTPHAKTDHRADLFAVGAIAYRCATGRVAFGKGNIKEVMDNVRSASPPPPTSINPSLPPEFDAFIARCLAKNPDERFQSARDLVDALQRILDIPEEGRPSIVSMPRKASIHPKPQKSGRGLWLALLALALLGGGLVAFSKLSGPSPTPPHASP